ncbi:MAG: multicopper oxidase domain-containing protein, partial [Candidatus Eremiobacteraeota bacterium]|nr:multicopper oxidase domain-containing protein [Candidatus Eremiobacteraeota bacterium]
MGAFAIAPLSERALAEDTIAYTLTASGLLFKPAPGIAFKALAYNGSLPGPVLRVARGQRFRATYLNRSGVSTSIHWHGMILPNAMDGSVGVTQAGVPHGQAFIYDFHANPAGTRWYHDHDVNMGMTRGLFGMIIVEDPSDEKADAEFAVVFHDVPRMETIDAAVRGT